MLTILLVLIIHTGISNTRSVFNETADSLFKSIIGGVDDTFAKMDAGITIDKVQAMQERLLALAKQERAKGSGRPEEHYDYDKSQPALKTDRQRDDYDYKSQPTPKGDNLGDDNDSKSQPTPKTVRQREDYDYKSQPTPKVDKLGDNYDGKSQPTRKTDRHREDYDNQIQSIPKTDRLSYDNDDVTEPTTKNKASEIPLEELKMRMRKLYITSLIEVENTPMPDFSKNSDGNAELTRRFNQIVKQRRPSRRFQMQYDYLDGPVSEQKHEKEMTISLMEQFIYSTQYKWPYLLLLRKKYSYHNKYKIGYCFALLRQLQQQQRIIYTTLDRYHVHFNNLMIHLKMYEKVVRLDVDIRDISDLIGHLNHQQKIKENPDYYVGLLDNQLDDKIKNALNSSSLDQIDPSIFENPDYEPGK